MSTIKDIADEVGISKAAVSRILNHKGSFSLETILKVERAAKRLNYVSRNEMVEGEEESKTIAAIFPDKGIYFSILTTLLEKACFNYGYNLLLCSSQYDNLETIEFMSFLRKKHVAGILFGSISYDQEFFKENSIPIVSIGHPLSEKIPFVHSDNFASGRIAAKHLLGRGTKEFLYISNSYDGLKEDERYLGYCEELEKAGHMPWPYILKNNSINYDGINASEIITQMILEHPHADGLFAESQTLAMECVQAYLNLGYKIPQDIKIIGYGNSLLSRYSNPTLSLVKENTREIAFEAVSTLADLIENGKTKNMDIKVPVSIEHHQSS